MNEPIKCEACGNLISKNKEWWHLYLVSSDDQREDYFICSKCELNLEDRINNAELTPAGE